MQRVQDYYNGRGAAADLALSETSFMEHVMGWLGSRITQGITLVGALFMFSLAIMLSNFSIMRKREDESERKAAAASTMANRDQLTGVKNKRAYAAREEQLELT